MRLAVEVCGKIKQPPKASEWDKGTSRCRTAFPAGTGCYERRCGASTTVENGAASLPASKVGLDSVPWYAD
jgi:hypothetical protein